MKITIEAKHIILQDYEIYQGKSYPSDGMYIVSDTEGDFTLVNVTDGIPQESITLNKNNLSINYKENTMTDKEEMREEMLIEQRFESQMRNDEEFFFDWTVENLYIMPEGTPGLFLFDIINKLKDHCRKYEQSFEDLCNYIGDK